MLRRLHRCVVISLLCCAGLSGAVARAAWPERPITLVVGWVMGSGSDLIARELASGLQKELGVPVSVMNLDGGDGVFAHSQVAFGTPDGYTLGLVTPEYITAFWTKQTDYALERFTPIAQVEQSAAALWVKKDSPWRTLNDVLTALRKAPPGRYRMSGMAIGGAYHIAMVDWFKANGLPANALAPVSSEGALSGLDLLASGEVDLSPNPLHEGHPLRLQGKIRPLALFARDRLATFPDVPTVREQSGKWVTGGTWRVLMGPPGLSPEIAERLARATLAVSESESFKHFLSGYGFGAAPLSGSELHKMLLAEQSHWGSILAELRLRKR